MINEEIVTYLKGKEKFEDDYFIFKWAKYSSLIKKDKDPGQYLSYLFIIYYFGPNEIIQDAAKKLIDDISPKEILQFQENFIEIARQLDSKISEVFSNAKASDDYDPYLSCCDYYDPYKDDLNFDTLITKEINKPHYPKDYLESILLPIFLVSTPLSAVHVKFSNPDETNIYLCVILTQNRLFQKLSFLQNNYFFLNYCLKPTKHNQETYLSHGREPDDSSMIFEQATHNFIIALGATNDISALNFIESEIEGGDPDPLFYGNSDWGWESYYEVLDEVISEFDIQTSSDLDINQEKKSIESGVVCITGKVISFDSKAKARTHIESLGFEVKNTFTNDVTILVNESGIDSAKAKKARENKILIVTDITKLKKIEFNKGKSSSKEAEKNLKFLKAIKALNKKDSFWYSDVIEILFKYAKPDLRANKFIVMAAVKAKGVALAHASKELQNDKEIVLEAVKQDADAFKFASKELKWDKEVFLTIKMRGRASALEFASSEIQDEKELVITALEDDGIALKHASTKIQNDKKFIMALLVDPVRVNYWTISNLFNYVSKELQDDKEITMAAIKKDGSALKHASKKLKNNREVVIAAVEESGWTLKYVSKELQADKEVVMAAVKHRGISLQYVSKELQADKEVVMAAVKQYGLALQYASKELQADKDIVIAAAIKSVTALKYASIKMQKDSDVLEPLMPKNILIGRADDKEFVMRKLKIQPMAFQFVSKKLQVDREVAIAAFDNFKGSEDELQKLLDLFPKELMADKKFCKVMIGDSGWIDTIAQYIPNNLLDDEDFMMYLFKNVEYGRISLPKKIENKDIITIALKYYSSVLQLATNKIKNDKEFIMTLIAKGYPLVIADISKKLQNDKDIVMAAVAAEPLALIHASIKMQKDSDVRDILLN